MICVFVFLSDIVWSTFVGQNVDFILQDMIVSWWPVILLAWLLFFFFFFLQLFLVWFTGSGEHSREVFLQTLLILISSEVVSGPRPALDSPAWAPVPLHGISAPIIRYTRHKQAPLFLLLMFYICVLQWHKRPLLEMVMWTGVCMDGGVWSGSVREYGQTVGH